MADAMDVGDSKDSKDSKECECCVSRMSRTVKCPYCQYRACMRCMTTFMTTQITDTSCMSCKKAFSYEFMAENFTQDFMKKALPAHRKKILFEIEKAMLPQTMPYLEHIQHVPQWTEELMSTKMEIDRLQDRCHVLSQQLEYARRLRNGDTTVELKEEKSEAVSKRIPVSCPVHECRGFLNIQGKCGVCSVQCCKECREICQDPETHVCNADILATVKALEKECRKCPQCAVPIFRIDGCDQMWCVNCHTAFNWKTGKVETGRVHNPHYFQYLRDNNPEQLAADHRAVNGNGNCNMDRQHQMAVTRLNSLVSVRPYRVMLEKWVATLLPWLRKVRNSAYIYPSSNSDISYVYRVMMSTADHINYVYLNRVPVAFDNRSNIDLRIRYLMKELTQEEFQATLLRRQKSNTKLIEYREIIETYLQLFRETLARLTTQILNMPPDHGDVNVAEYDQCFTKFMDEITKIDRFSNDAIQHLNKIHGGRKCMLIGEI